MASKHTVPVRIQGREYRVRSDWDADLVERAAELLDDTMRRVSERSASVDSMGVAVLAGLNVANHLVLLREERQGSEPVPADRVLALTALLESALDESSSP